jgi:hypothetical protein
MTDDLIGRAEAQTAIQFAARRYMVAHEAHGEGQVVWSDNLINVTDAMNVLRDLPSVQPETNRSEIPNNSDTISRQAAIDAFEMNCYPIRYDHNSIEKGMTITGIKQVLDELPPVQPERKTGYWILDRSGAYCCDKCMEPCATYAMMRPRDKFCKMCGSRNEVME